MDPKEFEQLLKDHVTEEIDPIERIILRSMHEGVITLECNGNIHMINQSALRILGLEEAELIGQPFDEVFSQEPHNEDFKHIFTRVIHHREPTIRQEVRFKRPDGQFIDLSMATSFLEVDQCVPFLQDAVAVFRDITPLKSLERVRRRAVDHLSHELKTPLSIINASVEGLMRNNRGISKRAWHSQALLL